jgi:urea carboxylase-associated protein 2
MDSSFYRQRYEALLAAARDHRGVPVVFAGNPNYLSSDVVVRHDTIPPGWYDMYVVPRGQTLRLVNISGTPGVSALLWNADDTADRLSVADTGKIQWRVRLQAGALLYSDMGRVLASITDDTCGHHDLLLGGSSPQSLRRRGLSEGRNSRDNFILAIGKRGMGKRDIPPAITFFAAVRSGDDGRLSWVPDATGAGDRVDLRAEMNLLVVVSNCPHPLAPDPVATGIIEVLQWRSPPPAPDDACRNATPEAVRAFAATDRLFGG